MKFDLTSLASEPLLYFLLHSAAFVAGVGLVFFLLGLFFGALTWRRYRRYYGKLQAEGNELRNEIAGLKRKLAEQSIKPLTAALPLEEAPGFNVLEEDNLAVPPSSPAPVEQPMMIPSIPAVPELRLPDQRMVQTPLAALLPAIPRHSPPISLPQTELKEDVVEPFSFLMPDEKEEAERFEETAIAPEKSEGSTGLDFLAVDLNEDFIMDSQIPAQTTSSESSLLPEEDPALGLIFKKPPPQVDDLTRLNGISPVLQKHLNELGVYRFNQIALWDETQISEFSRRLAFKDRIEREHWVDQARRLTDRTQA